MTAPVILGVFVVLANSLGSRCLAQAQWTQRSPALGIVAWQALTASVVMAGVLAGAALALPSLPATSSIASLLEACADALRAQYQTPGGAVLSIGGACFAIGITGRIGYFSAVALHTSRRARNAQYRHLALAARRDSALGIFEVQHAASAVYCVPGRAAGVVVTSGARAMLDDAQLHAVIAHERAHLGGRHDLVVGFAGVLRRSLPGLACMRIGHSELVRLVEMRADDVALRDSGRLTLARALVNLSQRPVPAGSLGAGGSALIRLRRLTEPPRPIGWGVTTLVALAAITLLAVPLAIAIEPAAAAAMASYCPITIEA